MNPTPLGRRPSMPIRLLVSARARDELGAAISERLPGVPWGYASDSGPADWSAVSAILVGSARRELAAFDAAATPQLEFVQQLYTGVDGFPFGRFPTRVRVASNVGAVAPFVAEHAVTLALAAARDLPGAMQKVREGVLRPPPVHRVLRGRRVVILGYGEIGRGIAARLAGFEPEIVGLNRTGIMAPGISRAYPAHRLREAVTDADFVFEARPLTRGTAGSIGAAELAAISPTGVFVNVGRAGTVDEGALYEHLRSHPEFRAAIDVWWGERFEDGRIVEPYPFGQLPNFLGTPHCAAGGDGVESYALARALSNLARFFAKEPPLYVVDRSEYEAPAPS